MRHNRFNYMQCSRSYNNGRATGTSNVAKVSIVCDRKRVISCMCTCSFKEACGAATMWCAHVVATALYRILEPQNVQYRAPILESLIKLNKDQLQKFSLHLISELISLQVRLSTVRGKVSLLKNRVYILFFIA